MSELCCLTRNSWFLGFQSMDIKLCPSKSILDRFKNMFIGSKHFRHESEAESFYNIKYWNISHYVNWFLVCCFFLVIWNVSQINVFKTKCKSKSQNDFLGNYFWNLKHQCLLFTFSLLRIIWRTFDVIIDVQYLMS